ncbi:MAG: RagB/SusD family nutrient uptake outer membrane protein, partial [Rikenellaceae bacterium]|nr:RagB/SusD family nutrient uptake outer membrane protein [Rikenellaceae bacterium]
TLGVQIGGDNTEQSFFYNAYRNRRMNYYAVMALKMRACMYAGDNDSRLMAGNIAKQLIESQSFQEAFPWGRERLSSGGVDANDFIYSREIVFGIHVQEMYDQFANLFLPTNTQAFTALPTSGGFWRYMFNFVSGSDHSVIDGEDPRLHQWVGYNTADGTSTSVITTKFRRPTRDDAQYRYFYPLIRKSEVYLTAAEVFQDVAYVDEIRNARGGLKPLDEVSDGTYDLQDQILREWMKDFVSEGQLFYYYKRRAQTSIIGINGGSLSMSTANYMPHLPLVETER